LKFAITRVKLVIWNQLFFSILIKKLDKIIVRLNIFEIFENLYFIIKTILRYSIIEYLIMLKF